MDLQAAYFVFGFVAILLVYITFIVFVARRLNNNISRRTFGTIEGVIIAGIVLGIIGLFQPWLLAGYRYGFLLLLFSTLLYIVWSHVTPLGNYEG